MHHDLNDICPALPAAVRALPPSRPPASVADDGRVRIGAGLGLPATRRV